MKEIDGKEGGAVKLPWAHLRLAPFPQVAIRVLQLAKNDNVPMRQMSDLICSDPAFSSEVLIVVNSFLYAPRYPITSILHAVAVLGTDSLKGLCLTVGARAFLGKSLSQPSMRALWRHNLACAYLAERLSGAGLADKGTAYTAGAIHDLGRLALAVVRPQAYTALLESHVGSASSILEGERDCFGMDHCEAGRRLIDEWNLPVGFRSIVSQHHSPRLARDSWEMADLINVSCRLADTIGFSAFPGCSFTPYAELLEELPPRERRCFGSSVEELAFEVGSKINALESL